MAVSRNQKLFDSLAQKIELPMLFSTLLLLGLIIIRNSFVLSPEILAFFDIAEFTLWSFFLVELVLMSA